MNFAYTPYVEETYGIGRDQAVATPIEVQEVYAKLLLLISGADGISDSERAYFIDWLRASGHPDALARNLLAFDPSHADIDEMLAHFKTLVSRTVDPGMAQLLVRAVIYDGIRVACQDVYHDRERTALRKVGKALGIDDAVVDAIETQVRLEASVRKVNQAVGSADGAATALSELETTVRQARITLLHGTFTA